MKNFNFLLVVVFMFSANFLSANNNPDSRQNSIFEALATPDSATRATVKIYQDKRIEQLLVAKESANLSQEQTMSGFRVQVFSSNTQRTAKTEAFKIEKQLLEEYPEQGVYVNYISPFWKVRVGDFKTQTEAQAFRKLLIDAFPDLRTATYVVREQILVSGKK